MNLNKHPVPVHNKMSATQAGPKDICNVYRVSVQTSSPEPEPEPAGGVLVFTRFEARTEQSRPDILPKLPLLCQPGALEPASF